VFCRIFPVFSKIKNFKIEIDHNSNLKNCQNLNWYKKLDPTASKSTSHSAFKLYYGKAAFVKATERKQLPLVKLLFF
jgi:hypothetical protein